MRVLAAILIAIVALIRTTRRVEAPMVPAPRIWIRQRTPAEDLQ